MRFSRMIRRSLLPESSIGCWPRPPTASAGAGTGSTSSVTPTPPAKRPTILCREAYRYRNYVWLRSTPTNRTTNSSANRSPATSTRTRLRRNSTRNCVTATGFIAISRRFGFDPENYQHLTIQDTIDTLGQAVLGLSLGCAMPRPQIRSRQCGGLLRALRHLRQHALRVSRIGREEAAPRFVPAVSQPEGTAAQGKPRRRRTARIGGSDRGRQKGSGKAASDIIRALSTRKARVEAHRTVSQCSTR